MRYGGADVKVLNLRSNFGAMIAVDRATLLLERVDFGFFIPKADGAAHLTLATGRLDDQASAALYNTTFADVGKLDVSVPSNGRVYVDNPGALRVATKERSNVKPLSEVPSGLTFVRADDPELEEIQQVRTNALCCAHALRRTTAAHNQVSMYRRARFR